MSRTLAFVADLHIANHRIQGGPWTGGINRRGLHTTGALGNALSIAEAHKADRVVVLGDVFDGVRPEPQLIAETQRMINAHALDIRIIKGNHDSCSSETGDHTLGPLGELGGVEVFEKPWLEEARWVGYQPSLEILYIPFEAGPAGDWLPKRLAQISPGPRAPNIARILCLHLGVYDPTMLSGPAAHWIKQADDAIGLDVLARLCFEHDITLACAGNWHSRQSWVVKDDVTGASTSIVQVGTLCPTGWDNPGLEGYGGATIATFGNDGSLYNLTHLEVPGPRFVTVHTIEELGAAVAKGFQKRVQLYVRVSCKPAEISYFTEALTALKDAAQIEAFDIVTDKTEMQTQARQAAEAARSTTTMQAVLEAFVTKMPIPEGVDRERVFNRSKTYLEA